ncbi:hypothetical protein TD95_000034 [Thielaviopsis punctulata]|uniref:Uncharacterized protein n=1 Tax=Thielaviopsis punctulata TaxID=72032 RepID=A0A0F4Z7C5_9PEZI|nr:hypothetical protein TD95_000034 [Thielaviopsis punctulata]
MASASTSTYSHPSSFEALYQYQPPFDMAHSAQQQQSPSSPPQHQQPMMNQNLVQPQQSLPSRQKRKREDSTAHSNERLSKRLSLLNLGTSVVLAPRRRSSTLYSVSESERTGPKLYVPVEAPAGSAPVSTSAPVSRSSASASASASAFASTSTSHSDLSDRMEMDDSKHKVYIYNIDDELSSSESEPEDGRIMFHPDIQRHLMATRIPPTVKVSPEGELAGMQLVLYREPTALTVPESQDSVRRAVIEARKRIREKQRQEAEVAAEAGAALAAFPAATSSTISPPTALSPPASSSPFSRSSQAFISPTTSPFTPESSSFTTGSSPSLATSSFYVPASPFAHDVMSSGSSLTTSPVSAHQQNQPSLQSHQHQSVAESDGMEMDLD